MRVAASVVRHGAISVAQGRIVHEPGAGLADEVERARDDDGAVGAAGRRQRPLERRSGVPTRLDRPVAARRRQRSASSVAGIARSHGTSVAMTRALAAPPRAPGRDDPVDVLVGHRPVDERERPALEERPQIVERHGQGGRAGGVVGAVEEHVAPSTRTSSSRPGQVARA